MVNKGPVSKLKEQLSEKEVELAEIKALMLRKAAEFDNARKRWERERDTLQRYASAQTLKDMIEVWDNFERALEVEDNKSVEAYRRGVEIIFTQFREALAKHELKQYSCLGEDFDPVKAEAVGYFETDDEESGKIAEELKKGFMLGEMVLRPAQVIVAKEIKKKEAQDENPEQDGG